MFTMLDDFRNSFGIAESALGFIVGIGFFASFLGQVTLAPLADRGRARRLIVLGLGLEVIGCIGMAFGTSFIALLISRLIMGLGAGTALPALRRVIIVADPENFGSNLGRILSFEVAGFTAGPIVALIFAQFFGIPGPFIFLAALIAVFMLVIGKLNIPETAKELQPTERFAIDLLKNRAVLGSILVGIALYVMIGVYDSLWVIMMDDLKAPHWVGNAGVALFGLPWIFFGALGGRIAQKHGPLRVSAFGLALGSLYMTSYGFMTMPYLMLGVGLTQSMLDSLTVTGIGVAVAQATPPERQAGASGLLGGMQTLMGGLAAMSAGTMYEHFGQKFAFTATGVAMAILVSVGCFLVGKKWLRKPVPAVA